MQSAENILQMSGIRKVFPGVVALNHVDFALRKGEVHILLGENGAGKSTLMKVLSGAYQKTSGEMVVAGRQVEIKSPKHAQDLGISIIYQELNLVPFLTAAENIFLGREPVIVPGVVDRARLYREAQRLLDELGVDVSAKSLVRDLGVAQQQMVEVAKALSLDARILTMDEPTSALTDNEIRQLFATIRRLQGQGVSIIYISHRLEELFEIGDRVTVLRDGEVVATHAISEVTRAELVRLMAGREVAEHYPKELAELGDEILRVEGVNVPATLHDIHLTLHHGEVLGIFGLLGSGRTELARTLFGLEHASSGETFVRGEEVKIDSPRKAIDLGIAFLTEDRKTEGLVLELSVKNNIALPSIERLTKGGLVNGVEEVRAAEQFVQDLSIKTTGIDQKTVFLSGGNQQKVVLSKWLYTDADIFIFDEPTRGIDVASKVEIYQLMNQLTARGVAILMISSEMPEILGMSDRILVMRNGTIAGEFEAKQADQESILTCALGEAA